MKKPIFTACITFACLLVIPTNSYTTAPPSTFTLTEGKTTLRFVKPYLDDYEEFAAADLEDDPNVTRISHTSFLLVPDIKHYCDAFGYGPHQVPILVECTTLHETTPTPGHMPPTTMVMLALILIASTHMGRPELVKGIRADIIHEHQEAIDAGKPILARWVLIRGYGDLVIASVQDRLLSIAWPVQERRE